VTGELIGANIETLEMAKGTSIWPPDSRLGRRDPAARDVEEAPQPQTVKHWLRNYLATGVLGGSARYFLARPMGYTQQAMFELWDTVQAVLAEAGRRTCRSSRNVDYGHTSPAGVLPLGCNARVDPVNRTINVVDAGVR